MQFLYHFEGYTYRGSTEHVLVLFVPIVNLANITSLLILTSTADKSTTEKIWILHKILFSHHNHIGVLIFTAFVMRVP